VGNGRILKLFHAHEPRTRVEAEAHIGRIVASAGLSAPQVFEVVEQDGRWGIVYERMAGSELAAAVRPWNAGRWGREMARLHSTLFAQRVPDLPRQRERLARRISTAPLFSAAERQHFMALLDALPDSDVLCHGDFHPANLLQTAQGLTIIDWNDATQGHPAADIARTILILEEVCDLNSVSLADVVGDTTNLPGWVKQGLQWLVTRTLHALLHGYRQEIERLLPEAAALIPRWMPVLAVARLHEGHYQASDSPQTQRMVSIARQMKL
jgi:thiamine kinase-like enzyme